MTEVGRNGMLDCFVAVTREHSTGAKQCSGVYGQAEALVEEREDVHVTTRTCRRTCHTGFSTARWQYWNVYVVHNYYIHDKS